MQVLSANKTTGIVRLTGGLAGDRQASPEEIKSLIASKAIDADFPLTPVEVPAPSAVSETVAPSAREENPAPLTGEKATGPG